MLGVPVRFGGHFTLGYLLQHRLGYLFQIDGAAAQVATDGTRFRVLQLVRRDTDKRLARVLAKVLRMLQPRFINAGRSRQQLYRIFLLIVPPG